MSLKPEVNPFAPPQAEIEGAPGLPPSEEQLLAPRGERFAGAFVDGLLVIVCMIPGFLAGLSGGEQAVRAAGIVTGLAVIALYVYQWVLITRTGQSIGKRAVKTKIVMLDGSPVGFVSGVVLRAWVPLLLIFAAGFVLGLAGLDEKTAQAPVRLLSLIDALFIFGAAHRCLHDYIAGTKVISVRGSSL